MRLDKLKTIMILRWTVLTLVLISLMLIQPWSNGAPLDNYPVFSTSNPAAVYCTDMGYMYQNRIDRDSAVLGVCVMPDDSTCDAWEFLAGKCGQAFSYCAQQGYGIRTEVGRSDGLAREVAVCVGPLGLEIGSVEELIQLNTKLDSCGTNDQLISDRNGQRSVPEVAPRIQQMESDGLVTAPPPAWDWRNATYNTVSGDWTTPVKDQGVCGSCWAFASVGVSEAALNLAASDPGLDPDLAEQYLVSDCYTEYGYQTCCGGWDELALVYMRDFGIPDESCMPYVDGLATGCGCDHGCNTTGSDSCTYNGSGQCSDRTCSDRCADWDERLFTISETGYVGSNQTVIKNALLAYGPLSSSMRVGNWVWDGDVLGCSVDEPINHGVVIIGYEDTPGEGTGGYWIVRNSWGTSWNGDGHVKIAYGECSIESWVYYALQEAASVGPMQVEGYTVDDDTLDESNGNEDGIIDCGEEIELLVSLHNLGPIAVQGIEAAISTTDPYVTGPADNLTSTYPDIAGSGGTDLNTDDFEFSISADTPHGHVIQFSYNVTASNGGPWALSFDIPVVCNASAADILLVDDDDNNPDVLGYYSAILDDMALAYDIWDTGNSDNEPDALTLSPYSKVIWFTGGEWENFSAGPGPEGESALSTWLDGGGCLLISSQDYLYNRGYTSFMSDYLGIGLFDDDVSHSTITGEGSVFAGLGPYTLSYPFSNYSDLISPDGTAELSFSGNLGDAGVSKDGGIYRTAFLGFPLEAIATSGERSEVIGAFLDWCGFSTFADVPFSHPLHDYIEALWDGGYTAGCSTDPLLYCPDTLMDRAQAAVFMLRGQFGIDYEPPLEPWDSFADDWSPGNWAEKWAEGMYAESLSAGCNLNPLLYCPWSQLSRVEASVFGLRLKYGPTYGTESWPDTPPPATGTLFADMPDVDYWGTKWAEQAYLDGLLPACGDQEGTPLFCPDDPIDRGWGAYLIVQAKNLLP